MVTRRNRVGERRWLMTAAVLLTGVLRITLPAQLRVHDARPVLLVVPSFNTAMAFSPTDVSAIKPWAKLMIMAEDAISVIVGILVVARAVNILK
jgi:hypothetical protein